MKQVTIVVPKGNANLSSITGSFEILTRANEYWQKMGNKPMMEICIAGFVTELKLDAGFFSIHPVSAHIALRISNGPDRMERIAGRNSLAVIWLGVEIAWLPSEVQG